MKVVYARLTGRLFAGFVQDLLLATGIRCPNASPAQVELSDKQVEILSGRLLASHE